MCVDLTFVYFFFTQSYIFSSAGFWPMDRVKKQHRLVALCPSGFPWESVLWSRGDLNFSLSFQALRREIEQHQVSTLFYYDAIHYSRSKLATVESNKHSFPRNFTRERAIWRPRTGVRSSTIVLYPIFVFSAASEKGWLVGTGTLQKLWKLGKISFGGKIWKF